MLTKKLTQYNIILGSASARRQQLLAECGFEFCVQTTTEREDYPKSLKGANIAEFLAKQKAKYISRKLSGNYLLITADTIVIQNNKLLHKPKTQEDAIKILLMLSGKTHKVISGVCIKSSEKQETFTTVTQVKFNHISKDQIIHYIENYNPFDKAGSYGIQEWIGHIGVNKINGSYNNVVGLPTSELYQKLKLFI